MLQILFNISIQTNLTCVRVCVCFTVIWTLNTPSRARLPSAWPLAASPFWFMLFFLRCFFLSVSGDEEPTSLVEEELDTPSTAESANVNADGQQIKSESSGAGLSRRYGDLESFLRLTNTLSVVRQCWGTSLHTSVPQEERTTQSFHLLHLQNAAGTYWD